MTVGIVSFGHTPVQGTEVKAEAGEVKVEISDATLEVHRGPFSQFAMAERFASDPVFYQNLARFAALELRRQANSIDSLGNSDLALKGQLTELAEGFENTAAVLTVGEGDSAPQAALQAANIIGKVRDAYSAFWENHPQFMKFAGIVLAGYVLHQLCGVSADLSAMIYYAVVRNERLSDILPSSKEKK